MTQDLTLTEAVDGFNCVDDEARTSVIKGQLVKFTNDSTWELPDDEPMEDGVELVAIRIARVVQKWQDGKPVETRVLAENEGVPDIEALNDAVPRKEWIAGPDGKQRGPWQFQHMVYLLNPNNMDLYTFATGTIGGAIAVRELREKTNHMRRMSGSNLYPVVTLGDVHMNTRFGGRQRPHLKVQRFIAFGQNGQNGELAGAQTLQIAAAKPASEAPFVEVKGDDAAL
jgi:hypothetical protein